jgi:hypothetical protein
METEKNVVALRAAMELQRRGLISPAGYGKAATAIFEMCFPYAFDLMNPDSANERLARAREAATYEATLGFRASLR